MLIYFCRMQNLKLRAEYHFDLQPTPTGNTGYWRNVCVFPVVLVSLVCVPPAVLRGKLFAFEKNVLFEIKHVHIFGSVELENNC